MKPSSSCRPPLRGIAVAFGQVAKFFVANDATHRGCADGVRPANGIASAESALCKYGEDFLENLFRRFFGQRVRNGSRAFTSAADRAFLGAPDSPIGRPSPGIWADNLAAGIARASSRPPRGIQAHPHMLRYACGFALANKGYDTRATADLISGTKHPAYS
jgi:hypothetical protein